MYILARTESLTCFLIAILLIYLRPVEVPARQHRPVPFIPDPQTGLQPQVCVHLEIKLLQRPFFCFVFFSPSLTASPRIKLGNIDP